MNDEGFHRSSLAPSIILFVLNRRNILDRGEHSPIKHYID